MDKKQFDTLRNAISTVLADGIISPWEIVQLVFLVYSEVLGNHSKKGIGPVNL